MKHIIKNKAKRAQISRINALAERSYKTAIRRGKTRDNLSHIETASGIFDELEEFRMAFEHIASTHLPQYTEAQEELADIVIAGLTELHRRGVDVEKIITDKIKFNETRK